MALARASWLLIVALAASPAGAADTATQSAVVVGSMAIEPPAAATSAAAAADAERSRGGAAETAAPPAQADDDMVFDPAEPDFTIVNLPTTLRVPRYRFAFRVTHRFTRELGRGDFGDLAADLFGLDGGAQIGLELRFGLTRGWQMGIHRTSDRTIQLFTQYSALRQRGGVPVGVDAVVTFEGTNNLSGDDPRQVTGEGQRSPGVGAVVSRRFGSAGALYAMPLWVGNTNPLPGDLADEDDTFVVGFGGRLRIRPTVYLVGEIVPRLAGYDPGTTLAAFGIEKRVGGHAFQLNFSNGFGTTMGQIARGGLAGDQWFIGFNISRKFF